MNIPDLIIIVIITVCVVSAYHRGLVRAVFNLISWGISIFLANQLYPPVSKIMRNTALYLRLKTTIADSLGLEAVLKAATSKAQADLIDSMYIPDFIKTALLKNNNPEVYKILNVSGIEDYISGYVANIFINIISIIVVFCLVFIIMHLITSALDIVAKLPVINTFNKAGGALIGFFNATIIIWIIMTGFIFFIHGESYKQMFGMITDSLLAKWFYDTNIILQFVLKVVA